MIHVNVSGALICVSVSGAMIHVNVFRGMIHVNVPGVVIHVNLFVLRFYGPVNPMGSYPVRSIYLTTRLLGRLSPLSSLPVFAHSFARI